MRKKTIAYGFGDHQTPPTAIAMVANNLLLTRLNRESFIRYTLA
ncbi:MAG TPA: hypothetical protein VK184_13910 [Nostocaceae cyanobacterium]|nr:hypothetical protein [Nostocaceae cyanobacterium]